jgi:hypothetical protein
MPKHLMTWRQVIKQILTFRKDELDSAAIIQDLETRKTYPARGFNRKTNITKQPWETQPVLLI